jgi:hypothetical protein
VVVTQRSAPPEWGRKSNKSSSFSNKTPTVMKLSSVIDPVNYAVSEENSSIHVNFRELPQNSVMASDRKSVSEQKGKEAALVASVRKAMQPPFSDRGRWTFIISFIALISSVFSLYETTLKQARPAIHVGGVIQYAQDTLQPADVFIVPVTITNSGARGLIILELNLRVARADWAAPVWTEMTGLYNGSNLRQEKTLFTPISVAGGTAQTANILFYRDSPVGGAPGAIVNGNDEFRFCLTGRVAASEDFKIFGEPAPPRVQFDAEPRTFGKEDLIAGRTVALRVRNVVTSGTAKNNTGAAPGCG